MHTATASWPCSALVREVRDVKSMGMVLTPGGGVKGEPGRVRAVMAKEGVLRSSVIRAAPMLPRG
jgi:hypothetical protein